MDELRISCYVKQEDGSFKETLMTAKEILAYIDGDTLVINQGRVTEDGTLELGDIN